MATPCHPAAGCKASAARRDTGPAGVPRPGRTRIVPPVPVPAPHAALRGTIALALLAALRAFALAREPCAEGDDVALLASPRTPVAGRPLRVVATDRSRAPFELVLVGKDGRVLDAPTVSRAGPPASAVAGVQSLDPDGLRAEVHRDGRPVACRLLAPGRRQPGGGATGWDAGTESLYSAWIEHLFAAPLDASLELSSLGVALRDPARNLLHGHLGLQEDDPGRDAYPAEPDCADLPYLLRAYFAWKLGLPFAYRRCGRGSATAPPRCGPPTGVTPPHGRDGFARLARTLADGVHSGNARTALDDDATDLYPIPLEPGAVRPGTVYADPYGHTLVVVQLVPQTPERPGRLLAVDAQPDQSVGRKRFWEGTFLFARGPGAGPGFKAFRPLLRDAAGVARPRSNASLAAARDVTPWSGEQAAMSPDEFYARMAALVDPGGLDPVQAYDAMLAALVEQLETRVRSVDNGERWMREHPGTVVPMPSGAAIFETTGPWEDYATPSRDLRLQIAMHVLEALPARIERRPALFVLGGRPPADARAEVERLHAARVAERGITYTRSDGSPWRLTVADVLARKQRLEVAYDPNDCIETRWGAAEGSDEHATCRRRAPAAHRARLEEYRAWFHERRRPVR